ncbi:unnamed protein product [Paramecium primaurelia]|uniref:Uncharacterized protein n=1 Tax=Paramecium primaurelia TaxID=5886 RepID=A0A8S1LHI3_PARPR|nr:unnamed protein product [Paramecium primaurelia]
MQLMEMKRFQNIQFELEWDCRLIDNIQFTFTFC